MDIQLEPVVFFIGNYGCGKTEVAVNFAVHRRATGIPVRVADLDLVNPYFRSREVREILESKGIEVIVPEGALAQSELPIVVPQIRGAIEKTQEKTPDGKQGITLLDVGGDDVGATVLGSLQPVIQAVPHDMVQVVNAMRPFTETAGDTERITRMIEKAARVKVTGVVGNTHLMDSTDVETIRQGHEYAKEVARVLGVSLKFITCEDRLMNELEPREFDCPVLPITRQLLPPWKRRKKPGSQNFLVS